MSITSYSELQTALTNWLARDDLTDRYPEYIALAESEFNRRLRTRQMLVTQSTTPSSGQFSLPTDFLIWVEVIWKGSPNAVLQYVHPSQLIESFPDQPAATPRYFSILGTTDNVGVVKIIPTSATAIDFTYYQKITALSTSNTSNWLLSAHPDLYLAASLTEAYAFQKDYDQGSIWKSRREDQLEGIKALNQKYRGPSYIRATGPIF